MPSAAMETAAPTAESATGEAAAMETTAVTASARHCAHAAPTDARRMPNCPALPSERPFTLAA